MRLSGRSLGFLVVGVVAAALVVAVVSSRGDDAPSTSGQVVSEYGKVTVTGTPLPAEPDSGEDRVAGLDVPVVEGQSFDGRAVSLDVAGSGKATMVVFLAHWCPHCNREIPEILEWAAGGVPDDLRIVGVATGSRPDQPNWPPSSWLAGMGWTWEVLADSESGETMAAYGGTSFPTVVLVNPDGTVHDRFSGEVGAEELGERINSFLAGGATT